MTRIEVDLAELQRCGAALRSVALTVSGVLTQLDGDLGPLVEQWPAPARDTHVHGRRQWGPASVTLAAVLSATVAALDEAEDTYRSVEAAATRRWS